MPDTNELLTHSTEPEQSNLIAHLVKASAVVAVLSITLWLVSIFRGAPYFMGNDHRLAPSLGLIKGYVLYAPRTGGPVLSTIYGPFTAFAYLPAALLGNPAWAIYAGTFFSLCFFFVPTALLLGQFMKFRELSPVAYFAALLSIGLVVQATPSIEQAATTIHADAPALGAAALSCFFLLRERRRSWTFENFLLGGIFAGISVFSKQNMVPFVAVAAVWLLFAGGMAAVGWFLAGTVGVIATTVLLLRHWLGDPAAIFFNLVTIPVHQPYLNIKLFGTFYDLQLQALLFLVPPLMFSGWRLTHHGAGEQRRPEWLLIASAMALSVTGVFGAIKLGGNINALAPVSYFALLAWIQSLFALPKSAAGPLAHPACLAMAALAILLGPISLMKVASSLRHDRGMSLVEQAYRFDRLHPGSVFFPEYPLAVLSAEGRLYNFAWGLEDRAVAGFKVSPQQFFRFIPATDVAAVENTVPYMEQQFFALCHEDHSLRPIPGLEGFKFCRIDRRGAASGDHK